MGSDNLRYRVVEVTETHVIVSWTKHPPFLAHINDFGKFNDKEWDPVTQTWAIKRHAWPETEALLISFGFEKSAFSIPVPEYYQEEEEEILVTANVPNPPVYPAAVVSFNGKSCWDVFGLQSNAPFELAHMAWLRLHDLHKSDLETRQYIDSAFHEICRIRKRSYKV